MQPVGRGNENGVEFRVGKHGAQVRVGWPRRGQPMSLREGTPAHGIPAQYTPQLCVVQRANGRSMLIVRDSARAYDANIHYSAIMVT